MLKPFIPNQDVVLPMWLAARRSKAGTFCRLVGLGRRDLHIFTSGFGSSGSLLVSVQSEWIQRTGVDAACNVCSLGTL